VPEAIAAGIEPELGGGGGVIRNPSNAARSGREWRERPGTDAGTGGRGETGLTKFSFHLCLKILLKGLT
jgi:hypothetical protein